MIGLRTISNSKKGRDGVRLWYLLHFALVFAWLACSETEFEWRSAGVNDGYLFTAPVGTFPPNGYGLYDMAGNVWEWCADWYSPTYYMESPLRNPKGPDTGERRVLRGGTWYRAAHTIRNAERISDYPDSSLNFVGFRCAAESNATSLKSAMLRQRKLLTDDRYSSFARCRFFS